MGVINVKISDKTEQEFRMELMKRKGYKKGAMGEAVEEALKLWYWALDPSFYPGLQEYVKKNKVDSIYIAIHQIISYYLNPGATRPIHPRES